MEKLEYFFHIGKKEKNEVKEFFENLEVQSDEQQHFTRCVKWALKEIKYDYYIATIEPTLDEKFNIVYEPNAKIERKIKANVWSRKAKSFYEDEECKSKLANLYELMLWYAWRIAKGYWTLSYVCDDSSSEGNFLDTVGSKQGLEPTGSRYVGGFADGVGNTTKIVKSPVFDNLVLVGGSHKDSGKEFPVSKYRYENNYDFSARHCVGVLVIKRK